MFIPIHDELVIAEYRHDLERKAEKERLFRSMNVSSGRSRPSFPSLSKWLGVQVLRLRCAIFPFNTAAVCTS
ncbi:MAG: hypothetical protein JXA89_05140 [Anaerolineae bacterium]|nr:hypothetical protein [Anaerolineae bacterium]